jgi:hypothetical protein
MHQRNDQQSAISPPRCSGIAPLGLARLPRVARSLLLRTTCRQGGGCRRNSLPGLLRAGALGPTRSRPSPLGRSFNPPALRGRSARRASRQLPSCPASACRRSRRSGILWLPTPRSQPPSEPPPATAHRAIDMTALQPARGLAGRASQRPSSRHMAPRWQPFSDASSRRVKRWGAQHKARSEPLDKARAAGGPGSRRLRARRGGQAHVAAVRCAAPSGAARQAWGAGYEPRRGLACEPPVAQAQSPHRRLAAAICRLPAPRSRPGAAAPAS